MNLVGMCALKVVVNFLYTETTDGVSFVFEFYRHFSALARARPHPKKGRKLTTSYKSSTRNWIIFIIAVLVAISTLTWVNYRFSVIYPGGKDFLARWMGARMWLTEGISPYDERVSLATQQEILGHPANPAQGEDKDHFVYPLTAMVFFGPFGLLEYIPARALWMTLLELSLAASAIISVRLVKWSPSLPVTIALVLFSVIWYHGLRTVIIGQFAGINALLIAGALLAIRQEKDILGGSLFALATAKPQMVLLIIPFVLLWALSRKRWGLIKGFLGSFLILLVATLILMPDWPWQMLRQVQDYPSYTYIGSPLSLIAQAVPALTRPLDFFLHLGAGIYLLVEWGLAWGKNEQWFLWTAFMTLVVTNLLAIFGLATTNYVMLLPVVFVIFKISLDRWGTKGRWFVGILLLFFSIGLWVLFAQIAEGNIKHDLYLPVPLFCLLGLWWMRKEYLAPKSVPA